MFSCRICSGLNVQFLGYGRDAAKGDEEKKVMANPHAMSLSLILWKYNHVVYVKRHCIVVQKVFAALGHCRPPQLGCSFSGKMSVIAGFVVVFIIKGIVLKGLYPFWTSFEFLKSNLL